MEIRRGDVVVCAMRGDLGKPRPAVVVQSDLFNPTHATVTLCPLTSDLKDAPLVRLAVSPSKANGLKKPSQVMIDKLSTLPRQRIRQVVGSLSSDQMRSVDAALRLWLALE
jgi:mRNA interferase MazF